MILFINNKSKCVNQKEISENWLRMGDLERVVGVLGFVMSEFRGQFVVTRTGNVFTVFGNIKGLSITVVEGACLR